MKKIFSQLFFILLTIQVSTAQTGTAFIADYVEDPGTVFIDVDVANMDNVAAITLYVEYDPAVLTFIDCQSTLISSFYAQAYPSVNGNYYIGISYSEATGTDLDGTLFTFEFNYSGGSSDLTFLEQSCEFATADAIVLPVVYTNGSISPDFAIPVTLGDAIGLIPGTDDIDIPITVDFSQVTTGVGSFTLEIEYNENVVVFDQVLNVFEGQGSNLTVNLQSSPTRIALAWNASGGSGSFFQGNLLDLRFDYVSGNTDLTFLQPACEISNYNAEVQNVNYTNGSITQDPTSMPNIIINSVEAAAGPIVIPVTVKNFDYIGAFDYAINFDPAVLQYTGLQNINSNISAGLLYNAVTGTLVTAWSATGPEVTLADDVLLFEIKFNYSGTDTQVAFDVENCSMSDYDTNPINALYIDGEVTELTAGNATLSMPQKIVQQQSVVDVPVEATGLSNVGAITLEIQFDPTKVIFLYMDGVHNELLDHGSFLQNSTSGLYTFAWTVNPSETQGVTIPNNENLFVLHYFYVNGVADLEFNTATCAIADFATTSINTTYIDGQLRGGIELPLKAMLQGPYNTSSDDMNTTLNNAHLIPLSQPYNTEPWNYAGTESVTSIPTDVVDWVLVEIRSTELASDIVERKAAFIMKNGDIVKHDNTSIGIFLEDIVPNDPYYIVVWHRNHIPVMTNQAVQIPLTVEPYDFTVAANCYGNDVQDVTIMPSGGLHDCMIAGDINSDGYLKYSGAANDRGFILARINEQNPTPPTTLNTVIIGYWDEDTKLDLTVSYLPSPDDRSIIINNIGYLTNSYFLNAVYHSPIPWLAAKNSNTANNGAIDISLKKEGSSCNVVLSLNNYLQSEVLDNLQFTISWEEAFNDQVIQALSNFETQFGLIPQGEPVLKSGSYYQVYVSISPTALPQSVMPGDEIIVGKFVDESSLFDLISIAENPNVTSLNGDFYVSVFGTDQTGQILTPGLSVLEKTEQTVNVYPNPVTGNEVSLVFYSVNTGDVTISLKDITGKQVLENTETVVVGHSKSTIDVSGLPSGIYFIKIQGVDYNLVKKLVIR